MVELGVAFLSYFIVFQFVPKKYLRYYFFIVSITLAMLAFYVIPDSSMDLYRYYDIISYYKEFTIKNIKFILEFEPLSILYFFFVSRLPDERIFSFINIFIIYGLSTNLIYKHAIRYELSKNAILISFMFLLFSVSFYLVVSTVRSALVFVVFIYFSYLELVEKKYTKLCWIIYVMLCLFHSSSFFLLIIRILLLLKKKIPGKIIVFFTLVWMAFIPLIVNILAKLNFSIFQRLLLKTSNYVGNLYQISDVYVCILEIVGFAVVYSLFLNKYKKDYKELDDFFLFINLLVAFTMGSFFITDIFKRFSMYLSFVAPLIVLMLFKYKKYSKDNSEIYVLKKEQVLQYMEIFTVLIIAIVSAVFYFLVHYKNLVFLFN
ncbi:EpsG family protein [Eubacterium maltosivorans]|uniref:EpsG family protein n=1 Tax=Eubacterium maltosivorans TaxID=2041044 RepID=UPI00088B8529|nr:EpsG family protein [Eubacterium maltosivorans]WPK79442.1 hypothetical protein EUMA32_08490 [Eubacterium maltosivorans]SDP40713.1 EpsG family protein [Eubacterium maltosivorans]